MNKINIQPIEKLVSGDGHVLDVHSIFYTIQGEGPHTGRPAIFIRLAGCNLQCPGCDTDYTTGREKLLLGEILSQVIDLTPAQFKWALVVITGGEPFRQNIGPLVSYLKQKYDVQIETNGTFGIPQTTEFDGVDIVCSPKTGKVHLSIATNANWFKYVVHHESMSEHDGLPLFALGHSASPRVYRAPAGRKIYLQPMDCQDARTNRLNLEAVIASCLKFGYTLQLQTHKILGME